MCTQLPARRALRLKAKLIKILGPVIAQLYVAITEKSGKGDDMRTNITKAIEMLAVNLNEIDFENTVVELLQGVRKNGVELIPAIIDLEFAGDMGTLYQVLWFVIDTNFSSFFSLLGTGSKLPETQQLPPTTKKTFQRK